MRVLSCSYKSPIQQKSAVSILVPCKSNERCWGLCSSTAYKAQPAPTAESSVQLEIGQSPQVRLLGLRGEGPPWPRLLPALWHALRLCSPRGQFLCLFACHNPWFLVPIDGWVPPLQSTEQHQARAENPLSGLFLVKLKLNQSPPPRWAP